MEKIRLLLADDHADVLTSLATRLRREDGIEVVGEASNSAQAIAMCLTEKPHVLLIDPIMRDGLGMNALRQISMRCPNLVIIVLTAIVDTALKIELRKVGVSQVFIKGIETTELVKEIHAVFQTRLSDQPI